LLVSMMFWVQGRSQAEDKLITTLEKIDSLLKDAAVKYPDEEVFFAPGKNIYTAETNIHTPILVSVDDKPTFISKVLYAELLNSDGKLVDKQMLSIRNGISISDFKINSNWKTGVYYINAYTQWMKNFPGAVNQKPVLIYNPDWLKKPVTIESTGTTPGQIEIFPEGGNWVTRVQQRFVIRVLTKEKMPCVQEVRLVENGRVPATARTDSSGMAEMSYTFNPSLQYQVQAGPVIVNIPVQTSASLSLFADNENEKRLFVQLAKDENTAPAYNRYLLTAISNHSIVYSAIFDFKEGMTAASLLKNKIPAGILDLVLWDENMNIVSERKVLIKINTGNPLISQKKEGGQQVFTFTIPDSSSVAIYIRQQPQPAKVQKPVYYNITDQQNTHNSFGTILPDSIYYLHTDRLLICQKTGKEKLFPRQSIKYLAEEGITISGNIKEYASKNIKSTYEVEMIINGEDSSSMLIKAYPDKQGFFSTRDAWFQKSAKVWFQGHNNANRKELMDVKLNPGVFESIQAPAIPPLRPFKIVATENPLQQITDSALLKSLQALAADTGRYKAIENVTVTARRLSPEDSVRKEYMSDFFNTGAGITMIADGNSYNIWQWLRGRIPGLRIEGDLNNPTVYFSRYSGAQATITQPEGTDPALVTESSESIQFFLNEIPVSKDVLNSLFMEDIAFVFASREPVPALGASYGMIAVYTKKGVANTDSRHKGMANEKRAGFAPIPDFYFASPSDNTSSKMVYYRVFIKGGKSIVRVPLPASAFYDAVIIGWDKKGRLVYERLLF